MTDLGKTGNSRYVGRAVALSLHLSVIGAAKSNARFRPTVAKA